MAEQIKPGYKTSEFWLMLAAELVGLLIMSGAIPTEGQGIWPRIIAGAVAILAALGYTVKRTTLKGG